MAALLLFGHREILHMLIGVGSAALAAAVALPAQVRRPEFPARDNEGLFFFLL